LLALVGDLMLVGDARDVDEPFGFDMTEFVLELDFFEKRPIFSAELS